MPHLFETSGSKNHLVKIPSWKLEHLVFNLKFTQALVLRFRNIYSRWVLFSLIHECENNNTDY